MSGAMSIGVGLVLDRFRGGGGYMPKGLVGEGDSITSGGLGENQPWISRLNARTGLNVVNLGHGGDLLVDVDTAYNADTAPSYNAANADTLIFTAATNDLFAGASLATLQAAIISVAAKAVTAGFKRTYFGTILPSTGISGGNETTRLAFNAWLKANYRTIDFASIPEAADASSTVYYLDGTHPTDALTDRMAKLVISTFGLSDPASDNVPSAFSFSDIASGTVSTVYTSTPITVLGMTGSAAISITGGTYSINGGAFTSSPGTVVYGDQVRARVTSSASNSVTVNAVVTIGGVSDTYSVTTAAAAGLAFRTPALVGTGTFTNSIKTVSLAAGNGNTIAAASSSITGKKVFAVTFDVDGGFVAGIGLSTVGSNVGGIGADANRSVSAFSNGVVYINGVSQGAGGPTYAQGDTIGCVVDEANDDMWFTKDGVNFYGNTTSLTRTQVEAGTNALDIAAVKATGALCAAVGSIVTSGSQFTLVNYPWTIPSGYSQAT